MSNSGCQAHFASDVMAQRRGRIVGSWNARVLNKTEYMKHSLDNPEIPQFDAYKKCLNVFMHFEKNNTVVGLTGWPRAIEVCTLVSKSSRGSNPDPGINCHSQ